MNKTLCPKILCLDDENGILNAIKRLLQTEALDVITTTSPFEALHLVSQENFAVVISDQKMPMMQGVAVLEKIREISPDTVRIILTAFADLEMAIDAINKGDVFKLLTKPWNNEELVQTVHQAVARHNLAQATQRTPHENHADSSSRVPGITFVSQSKPAQNEDEMPISLKRQMSTKILAQLEELHGLSKELDISQVNSVKALAAMGKMQNKSIVEHGERVSRLCKVLANTMSYPGDGYQLEVAALLHDLGKTPIPKEILAKPDRLLTPKERTLIYSHTLQGEALVTMIPFFKEAGTLINHHHEHFDGTGYPDGLKQDEIPLGARIIAVVDAFDNGLYGQLTSVRPVTSPQKVVQLIESQSPALFDPVVVQALKAYVVGCDAHALEDECTPRQGQGPENSSGRPSVKYAPSSVSPSRTGENSQNLKTRPDIKKTEAKKNDEDGVPWWLGILAESSARQNPLATDPKNQRSYSQSSLSASPILEEIPLVVKHSGERLISSSDLAIGMVLSRDLISRIGGKLLPAGTILKKEYLPVLQQFMQKESLPIYVYGQRYLPGE